MNKNESDQIWKQLRFHMGNFFGQTRADDVQKIEYKPRYVALLEMPSKTHENKFR